MSRQRSLVILLLAVASASLAGFAALKYTSQRPVQAAEDRDAGGTQVVLAARDLPVGHLLSDADVQTVRWPSGTIPAGYVTQPSVAVGRGLITSVRTNEPLLESKLAERGSGAGLPIVFPEGMRAVSIRVDEVIAVAGFVIPGNRVDVLITKEIAGSNQTYTQIIMQNLQVLAAGQTVQRDPQGNPMVVGVVTMMVTPEQGEKLVLAAGSGRIQLALRNMLDVDEVQTPGIGDARLLDIGRGPARPSSGAVATRPRPRGQDSTVIEVYKGGVRTLQRF